MTYFPAAHPEYSNDSYVSRNLAVVHIFFKSQHFIRNERGEFFSFVDFFSNVGGLIGLCMGVSAISVVEAVYFLTMRVVFNGVLGFREEEAKGGKKVEERRGD